MGRGLFITYFIFILAAQFLHLYTGFSKYTKTILCYKPITVTVTLQMSSLFFEKGKSGENHFLALIKSKILKSRKNWADCFHPWRNDYNKWKFEFSTWMCLYVFRSSSSTEAFQKVDSYSQLFLQNMTSS